MKNALLASTVFAVLAANPAQSVAGDSLDPSYDWSGVYVTGSLGYGWPDDKFEFAGTGNLADIGDKGDLAWGGAIGIQKQWNHLVVGLEGGIDNIGGSVGPCPNATFNCAIDDATAFIIGPRLGFAVDRFLLSVSGGYAGADIKTYGVRAATGVALDFTEKWHNGWILSAAVDYAVTENIILGASYKHIDLGSEVHLSNRMQGTDDREVSIASDVIVGSVTVKFNPF